MGYSETIQGEIATWEGMTRAPHRFGGVEFNLVMANGRSIEIGHIHGNHMVDIPFTRKLREALVAESKTSVHHLLPETGWASYYLKKDADVEGALFLLRLSYLQKLRTGKNRHNPEIEAEIRQLNLSPAVLQAILGEEYVEESLP